MDNENSSTVIEKIIKEVLLYKDEPILKYEITAPFIQTGSITADKKINDYYEKITKDYINYCNNILYKQATIAYDEMKRSYKNEKFIIFSASKNNKTTYNKNYMISTYQDTYEYTGGEYGMVYRYSSTFNTNNGEKILLYNFFKPKDQIKKVITDYIKMLILKDIKDGDDKYLYDWENKIVEKFNFENYFLVDDAIAIYYEPYDIKLFSEGIVTFYIPNNYLKDYI